MFRRLDRWSIRWVRLGIDCRLPFVLKSLMVILKSFLAQM